MTESAQSFRSAFHGFNREDVVRFLETTVAKHGAQVHELEDEIKRLEGELEQARQKEDPKMPEELEALRQENEELKKQVEELENQLTAPQPEPQQDKQWEAEELAAYRRAENVERQARTRAAHLSEKIDALMEELTSRLEGNGLQIDAATESMGKALEELQTALDGAKNILASGIETLHKLEQEEK